MSPVCRHLSRGHFSSDNQILVIETEKGIPIYQARVGGAQRLVVSLVIYYPKRRMIGSLPIHRQYQVDSVIDSTPGVSI